LNDLRKFGVMSSEFGEKRVGGRQKAEKQKAVKERPGQRP